MNFLITGIHGFVASHLVKKLTNEFPNDTIVGFGIDDNVLDFNDMEYDYIFHLASIARTNECIENGITSAHQSNVELTRILLNKFKYKKFIYTSSCAIYAFQIHIVLQLSQVWKNSINAD